MNDNVELFPFFDGADLQITPPSRLYNLEPIGISTGMVESLSSYIGRLADAHTTSVSMLIKHEISNYFKHSYLGPNEATGHSYDALNSINGRCNTAAGWVMVLEALTLRQDLRFLTFLPYREMLGDKFLLKRHRHWCPKCFDDWRKQGHICYEPLIWKTFPVHICPIHSSELRKNCPHCGHYGPDLEPRFSPGYCPKCLNWLGDGASYAITDPNHLDLYQEYSFKVAELVAAAPKLQHVPTIDNITALLHFLTTKRAKGSRALGRLIRCGHDNIVNWSQGKYPPNFQVLVKMWVMFKLDPADIASQQPTFLSDISQPGTSSDHETSSKMKPQGRIQWKELNELMTAMAEGRVTPLPVVDIAKNFGCSVTSLYKKCPDMCGTVSRRFYEAQKELRRQHLVKICTQVSSLMAENDKITKKDIYLAIGGKGKVKKDLVRDVFEQA